MPKKLVLVDDEELIRISIQDYFEDRGWSVAAFNSAEEALAYLVNETADSIIVDMRLPGMTGFEFITRANKVRSNLRFVIYTGSDNFFISEDLRALGIDENCIVHKPAENLGELLKAAEQKS